MSPPVSSGTATHTVLIVDDTPENLVVVGELLQPQYRVRVANSGPRALRVAHTDPRPDLILLDVMMPEMDGYEVLRQLQSDAATRDIPVIFVTAMDAEEDEERGLTLGAVDYLTKPIRPAILGARVRTHLALKQSRDWLRDQNGYLESEIGRRARENELIKDASLHALALLAETRDNETGNHLRRTQAYVEVLIGQLRDHPRFVQALHGDAPALIAKAAPLHDIGKVGIPDRILLKPGKLTAEEFAVMKGHARIGADAIAAAIRRVHETAEAWPERMAGGVDVAPLAFLEVARQIALGHHEKWDGTGYPAGLAGDAIPVPARLMALADVYDALVCQRHYKPPFPVEQAESIIREGRGAHFDPDVVDAFLVQRERFAAISRRWADRARD